MAAWKIIIEIILAILSLGMGNSFWSCVKSPIFFGRTLANQDELKKIVSFIGKDILINEAKEMGAPPSSFGYEKFILFTISSSIKATDRGRNVAGLIFLIILVGSFYLSGIFAIINLACFSLMWFNEISNSAKNNVIKDINPLFRYIYGWHLLEPDNCKNFCLTVNPRFATIYKTIIS